jgi:hypothetical protein
MALAAWLIEETARCDAATSRKSKNEGVTLAAPGAKERRCNRRCLGRVAKNEGVTPLRDPPLRDPNNEDVTPAAWLSP